MTSVERNDLMLAQEKLEWVTPKISLMDAGETVGTKGYTNIEQKTIGGANTPFTGPS